MKIGITGATGHLGRLIIKNLKEKNTDAELVALVRSPEKAKDLGIEARYFDYTKPEALTAPLEDIDTLMFISASDVGKRKEQHGNIIKAAKATDVKRIVYTSLLHADTSPMEMAKEHLFTENAIKDSGIDYTFLRNGWYTENYFPAIESAVAQEKLFGSAGDGKIASAARADYAEAAAAVLTSEGHRHKIYELAGNKAFTLNDMAGEITQQTGKDIPYVNIPKEDYAKALIDAGLPEGFAKLVARWDVDTSNGALFETDKTLSQLIGHPTTSLAISVKEALK